MRVVLYQDNDWLFSKEAFYIYKHCMYKPTYEKYKVTMSGLAIDTLVKIFVCEIDGNIVGMIALNYDVDKAEIIGLAVSEEYRYQGIARHMIRQVMGEEGLTSLFAQTDQDAVGFYCKCGFATEEVVKEYPDGVSIRYDCELKI